MVLEWREREHETMDQEALQSVPTVHALRTSGLLNFFCTSPMRANVHLLEFMINYWDHDLGMFDLQGETLEITSENIFYCRSVTARSTGQLRGNQ